MRRIVITKTGDIFEARDMWNGNLLSRSFDFDFVFDLLYQGFHETGFELLIMPHSCKEGEDK